MVPDWLRPWRRWHQPYTKYSYVPYFLLDFWTSLSAHGIDLSTAWVWRWVDWVGYLNQMHCTTIFHLLAMKDMTPPSRLLPNFILQWPLTRGELIKELDRLQLLFEHTSQRDLILSKTSFSPDLWGPRMPCGHHTVLSIPDEIHFGHVLSKTKAKIGKN